MKVDDLFLERLEMGVLNPDPMDRPLLVLEEVVQDKAKGGSVRCQDQLVVHN